MCVCVCIFGNDLGLIFALCFVLKSCDVIFLVVALLHTGHRLGVNCFEVSNAVDV